MWSLVKAMTLPPVAGQLAGERGGEQPGRSDVDRVVPIEALDGGVEHSGVDALAVRHHQRVERAQQLGGPVHDSRGLDRVLQIRFEQLDATAGAPERRGQLIGVAGRALEAETSVVRLPVREHEVPAVVGQPGRDPGTDPP